MKILEVRDDFLKFEASDNITLSSFVKVSDGDNIYIGQVVKVKRSGVYSIACAKLLYSYDAEILPYNVVPISHSAEVTEFSFFEISKIFKQEKPVSVGRLLGQESPVSVDYSVISGKLLGCIENKSTADLIINNLKHNMSAYSNVLVIDTIGLLKNVQYRAGKELKLSLNADALNFLYEDCLKDATSDSKAIIRNIFNELSEYAKQVPFLPFSSLKAVVDDMVDKQHEFKLWVLKNKLVKMSQFGYFASDSNEANSINRVLNSKTATIDLSNLETVFLNRYLDVIYSELSQMQNPPTVVITLSNKINKKNLKNIIINGKVSAMPFVHSKFNYINEIKNMYKNYIIEPSFSNNSTFKRYNTFLGAIDRGNLLVITSDINYVPIAISAQEVFDENRDNYEYEQDEQAVTNQETVQQTKIDVVQKDAETIAIEKKSEDLIEKISNETESDLSEEIQIFDTKNESDEDDANTQSFSDEQEFHTEVDSTKLVKTSNDVLELEEEDVALEGDIDSAEDSAVDEEEDIVVNTDEDTIVEENTITDNSVDSLELLVENEEQNIVVDDSEENDSEIEVPVDLNLEIPEENQEDFDIAAPDDEGVAEENPEILSEDIEVIEDDELVQIAIEDDSEIEVSTENTGDALEEILINEEENTLELDDAEIDIQELDDNVDQEIVEDVDKVFTTIKEDTISDNDLDFIDELNNEVGDEQLEDVSDTEFEELELAPTQEEDDDTLLEPIEEIGNTQLNEIDDTEDVLQTKPAETNTLPIYDADIPAEDKVISDDIAQGDLVVHAKYGNGVVEKMIKYGNKTLFSINFDNVGRRLLDPTLTEIKKG